MINFYFIKDSNRHICEIQVVHKQMLVARKGLPGHQVYARIRNANEIKGLDVSDFFDDTTDSNDQRFATRTSVNVASTYDATTANKLRFAETECLNGQEWNQEKNECLYPTNGKIACSYPRQVRDPGTMLCRRRRSSDCEKESNIEKDMCYKFNDKWESGTGQIIKGYDESGCLDKFGRNLEKNHLDPITQECISNMNGHRDFWGRKFQNTCRSYVNGELTYLEVRRIAEDIYDVNNKVPSAVL